MADEAKQQIIARNKEILEAMTRGDYDAGAKFYTPGAILLEEGAMPVKGRDAIAEHFKKLPDKGMYKMSLDETFHFELITEAVAYSNSMTTVRDKDDKTKMIVKDGLLWKKLDGEWFLDRDIFNTCPLPDSQ